VLVGPAPGALLRKEKDEAGPTDCFWRNSSNAFIPVLRSLEAFLLSGFALVSQPKNRSVNIIAEQN
jgi:hypothetical protein